MIYTWEALTSFFTSTRASAEEVVYL